MAINVTPPARARAAQHKPLRFPRASRGLPRDPVCPLPLPQDTGPQREGSAPGSAAVPCPPRCRVLRHRRVQRWGTAPVPGLPSLGGQSRHRAAAQRRGLYALAEGYRGRARWHPTEAVQRQHFVKQRLIG